MDAGRNASDGGGGGDGAEAGQGADTAEPEVCPGQLRDVEGEKGDWFLPGAAGRMEMPFNKVPA